MPRVSCLHRLTCGSGDGLCPSLCKSVGLIHVYGCGLLSAWVFSCVCCLHTVGRFGQVDGLDDIDDVMAALHCASSVSPSRRRRRDGCKRQSHENAPCFAYAYGCVCTRIGITWSPTRCGTTLITVGQKIAITEGQKIASPHSFVFV